MNKKEFETRTRRLITDEDYGVVENLYMAAGNMGKDEFCKEMRAMCAYDAANDHIELRQCLKEIGRHVGVQDAELSFLKKTVKRVQAVRLRMPYQRQVRQPEREESGLQDRAAYPEPCGAGKQAIQQQRA